MLPYLCPGWWTSPERTDGIAAQEVTLLSADDIRRYSGFGWDLQSLPAPTEATSAATPMLRVRQTANCRLGPSQVYEATSILNQGQSAPIQGRNGDDTWWFVLPAGERFGCWVWAGAVEVGGDLSAVPLRQAPPTPTPTPYACWVQACQQCPSVCTFPCPPNATPGGGCTP